MIITCDKAQLLEALAMAGRAVAVRTPTYILECVLFEAVEGGYYISGNDKELFIQTTLVPAVVEETGSIALDAKLFTEVVRKLSGDSVFIETDDKNNALFKAGRSKLKLGGLPGEEFPVVPESEYSGDFARFSLPAAELRNMIRQTIFSIAVDHPNKALNGELIEIKNNIMQIVSVDMYRISYCARNLGEGSPEDLSSEVRAIVPGKALNELSRILPAGEEEQVSFFFTDRRVVFETDTFRLVSSLIEGDFVRFDQIFNEDFSTMVITDRLTLLGIFERAVLLAMENRMLPIKMEIQDDDMKITAQSERGNVDDGVPCETEGKDLTIYFNPKYFIEVLRAIPEERVMIKFNTTLSPCTIRAIDSEKGFKYLIVPMRPPA